MKHQQREFAVNRLTQHRREQFNEMGKSLYELMTRNRQKPWGQLSDVDRDYWRARAQVAFRNKDSVLRNRLVTTPDGKQKLVGRYWEL